MPNHKIGMLIIVKNKKTPTFLTLLGKKLILLEYLQNLTKCYYDNGI